MSLYTFIAFVMPHVDSSRLLLQNVIICETNNNCGGSQICINGQCAEPAIPIAMPALIVPDPWQQTMVCPREFCSCAAVFDPVYCVSGRKIYSSQCSATCNCEINCFKICKTNEECTNAATPFGKNGCIDIPSDGCDPFNGDTDCNGYCSGPMVVYGRPYNLDNTSMDLKAEFKQINCDSHQFYFTDIGLIRINDSLSEEQRINSWISKALSEHAAIGTFAKFALDLMSISAPLWFLEKANQASLEEIEHTKISFDILNMYIMNSAAYNKCIVYDAFPKHSLEIDGDYNRISLDAAIGGCFGETLSAFLTYFDGSIDALLREQYLSGIGMEEIRHSALAWVTVKWITEERGNEIEVSDVQWWEEQLLQRVNGSDKDGVEAYVYETVIPSILRLLWKDTYDYSVLYNDITQGLENHLNIYAKQVSNEVDLSVTVCPI